MPAAVVLARVVDAGGRLEHDVVLVDQQHAVARRGGVERRGPAGRPRADHQHLDVPVSVARGPRLDVVRSGRSADARAARHDQVVN